MQAREYALDFIMDETCIKASVFSRGYEWDKYECELLFADLLEGFKEKRPHFLGCIVLKQVPSVVGSTRCLVDGLQRLTTLSLLVYSLLEGLKSSSYERFLYTKEGDTKLSLLQDDLKSFKNLLCEKKLDDSLISKNYLLFKALLNKAKLKKQASFKEDFLRYILHSKMCVLINLKEQNEAKVYYLFNQNNAKFSLNARLKAVFFKKVLDLKLDAYTLYHEAWAKYFEGEATSFWQGSEQKFSEAVFFKFFAINEGFYKVGKHHTSQLASLYEKQLCSLNEEKFKTFSNSLFDLACISLKLPVLNEQTLFTFDEFEKRLLLIIQEGKLYCAMTLFLTLKKRLSLKQDLLKDCLFVLELFLLYRWIVSASTKDYARLFASLSKKLVALSEKELLSTLEKELLQSKIQSRALPLKEEFYKGLSFIKSSSLARVLLFFIELHRRSKMSGFQDSDALTYNFTLEHLLPKESKLYWGDLLKKYGKAAVRKSTQSLGNMTLLKQALNVDLQNKSWHTKLYGDAKAKGIKACADLKITKELFEDEQWEKVWDLTAIKEREEELSDEVLRIWDLGKV